jgi:hypothetical protein
VVSNCIAASTYWSEISTIDFENFITGSFLFCFPCAVIVESVKNCVRDVGSTTSGSSPVASSLTSGSPLSIFTKKYYVLDCGSIANFASISTSCIGATMEHPSLNFFGLIIRLSTYLRILIRIGSMSLCIKPAPLSNIASISI